MGENKIKYQKSVEWFRPFVESVSDLLDLGSITHIRGFRVKKGCGENTYGSTIKHKRKYSINIKMWFYVKSTDSYKRRTLAGVLEILAHELAHTRYWDHSVDQWVLQARIQSRFARVLRKFEITDTSIRVDQKFFDKFQK